MVTLKAVIGNQGWKSIWKKHQSKLRELNDRLMMAERALTVRDGLLDRSWYKHLVSFFFYIMSTSSVIFIFRSINFFFRNFLFFALSVFPLPKPSLTSYPILVSLLTCVPWNAILRTLPEHPTGWLPKLSSSRVPRQSLTSGPWLAQSSSCWTANLPSTSFLQCQPCSES